jgi:hypothetical protein
MSDPAAEESKPNIPKWAQEKQIAVLTSGLRKIDARFELSNTEQQLAFKNHKTQVCANP